MDAALRLSRVMHVCSYTKGVSILVLMDAALRLDELFHSTSHIPFQSLF